MKGFPHTKAHNVITTVEKLTFFNTLFVMIFQLYTEVFKIATISKVHPRTDHECPYPFLKTLRTGDADLRFYVTTVQDG